MAFMGNAHKAELIEQNISLNKSQTYIAMRNIDPNRMKASSAGRINTFKRPATVKGSMRTSFNIMSSYKKDNKVDEIKTESDELPGISDGKVFYNFVRKIYYI